MPSRANGKPSNQNNLPELEFFALTDPEVDYFPSAAHFFIRAMFCDRTL